MKKPIFVVQKHSATRLHFDFRLELDDVAKSWAIPKEPPRKEGIKVLAIRVDDHEIEYMDFEGIIPKGQYGAGKVEIWDKGSYELIDKKENKMVLNLNGKKLKGEFVLLKFKKAGENSWLFFKKKNKIKNYKSLIVKIPSLVPAGFIFVSIATIYFKLVLSAT